MKKTGHVACIGDIRHAHLVWVGMCEGRDQKEDIEVDENITIQ
jgi:hypothetical protein